MTSMNFTQFLCLYFCLWFAILVFLWVREELRRVYASEQFVVKERLYHCEKCHNSFLARRDSENVTRCPRCNNMCFLHKQKRF